ncbi:MAG: TIGR04076 family protein [Thermoplasmatota archaeon]
MLKVVVHKIKGQCPVYEEGDRIVIDDPEIDLEEETDALCTHALDTILHYSTALEHGASTVDLGLSKKEGIAYLQCVDPGEPYTEGGTVIFKIEVDSSPSSSE